MKYSFASDYSEMAHPKVLGALFAACNKQFAGYGLDESSTRAAQMIRDKIDAPSADVHFTAGGTQANLVIVSAILRPHEAVIAPASGHIAVHEAGAIEATGHKICVREGANGKISAADVESVVAEHTDEHMVKPRLVYLSQSTECGTVYTKAELSDISQVCRENNLYLHIDGARLGVALNSPACDLSYGDIARYADVFYLGGTKNGALFGEAIVIINNALKEDFRYLLKQRGALLAKGFAVGMQFQALLTDGLYDKLALRSNLMAKRLADGIAALGFDFMCPVETNIILPVLPISAAEKLRESFDFYDWQKQGDYVAIRLVTSWAAKEENIDGFLEDLKASTSKTLLSHY